METSERAVGAMQAYLRLKRYILPSGIAREALQAAIHFIAQPSAARELALEEALTETRTDLVILQGNVVDAARTDSRWEGMYDRVGSWIKRIDAALSSPDHTDAGKVEGDGIERAKFYHHQWQMERLLEARRDGLVDHSGGEAWRYEYSHKDEHGKYDILYRPVKNTTIPARLPSAPASEGAE